MQPEATPDPKNSPRWAPLFLVQFLGVFHDNFLKGLISFLAVRWSTGWDETRVIAWAANMLVVPYLLFSPLSGWLSRRYSKVAIVRAAKTAELGIAGLALAGFHWQDVRLCLGAVFLMGLHSCLYSPAKQGLVNDIGGRERISFGTGTLEMLGFVGSVLGMLASGLVAGKAGERVLLVVAAVSLTTALAGLASSWRLAAREPEAETAPRLDWNVLAFARRGFREAAAVPGMNLAVLGVSVFWMIGSLLLMNLLVHAKDALHLAPTATGLLQALMATGIALGCAAASWISGRQVALGLAPLGALGLAAGLAAMAALPLGTLAFGAVLFATSFAGGLYKVPIGAWIQSRVEGRSLGDLLAYANLANFCLMFLASLVFERVEPLLGSRGVFAAGALAAGAVATFTLVRMPGAFARLVAGLLVRTVMRVRTHGMGSVPARGGVLLVANHVSLLDALLVSAAVPRTVRFVVLRDLAEKPLLGRFLKAIGAIPVSAASGRRALEEFASACRTELERGRAVCIFAEGQVARGGQMLGFQRGLELVLRGTSAPVVPLHLEGVVGAPFSWPAGRMEWRPWRGALRVVHVRAGAPLPADSSASRIRRAVAELGSDNFRERFPDRHTLASLFLRSCRRSGSRRLWRDTAGTSLTARRALARSAVLAAFWRERFVPGERVGVLLPASAGGALVNVSLTLSGQVPVNLNFTASAEAMRLAVAAAGIETVVTSRRFLARLGQEPPAHALFAEDLPGHLRIRHKLRGLAAAFLVPVPAALRLLARRAPRGGDVAALLFSSGSTGHPKGIPLTHRNVLANLHGIRQLYGLRGDDVVAGTLPFFHAFGFTGTIWLPVAAHCGAAFHPNPTEAKAVAALVRENRATVLVTTPTFLEGYLRRTRREDFASLRFLVVGAEKLQTSLRERIRDEWGIPAREGYGATECSPIVAVNAPGWEGLDVAGKPLRQDGSRDGSVGRPLPGLAVRIVDPETGALRDDGTEGLVLVRGASVMDGYWQDPARTAEVLRDGWYATGDIGHLDEQGFLHLLDRLARFSKIGGEMVPHVRVEEALQEACGISERAFAVVGLPHPTKGERLAVLTTAPENTWEPALLALREAGLPPLWMPRRTDFVAVESIPVLGTGKLDLAGLRRAASERLEPAT